MTNNINTVIVHYIYNLYTVIHVLRVHVTAVTNVKSVLNKNDELL